MSKVTNLILSFSVLEDAPKCIDLVNSYEYNGMKLNLVSVDFDKDYNTRTSWYGGTKFLEACLYIGAFNYLDLDSFLIYLRSIPWLEPENVQVIVKEQDDQKFRIVELC